MADIENATFINATATTCEVCSLGSVWPWFILLAVMVNFILTVSTGPWSVWLLTRGSRATLEAEFFLLHLFCMDLVSVFLNVYAFLNYYVICKSTRFSFGVMLYQLCLHGLPMFQCCVCVERYLAVVHPVTFLKYKPLRYKATCLCVVWLLVLVIEGTHLVIFSPSTLLLILFPVVKIELFCSLSILWVLKRSKPGDPAGHREHRGEGNLLKKKAFIIISLLLVKLLINDLPLMAVSVLRSMVPPQMYRCNLFSVVVNICFFGSFVQPFLYLHRAGKLGGFFSVVNRD